MNRWAQLQYNGNWNPWPANPSLQWTQLESTNRRFASLQRSLPKGTHGKICPKGCIPEILKTGEILHYIPNVASKVPRYEALDSHYVLILEDAYKMAAYRDQREWCACLVISSHPPPELQHRPLRPRSEPCPNPEYSAHLSTALFDRLHALDCQDTPYCTHITTKAYDRKLWRAWDWSADSRISIEEPMMVQRRCLHLLRPLTPGFGVCLTADALETVYRMIAAQLAPNKTNVLAINGLTNSAVCKNATFTWPALVTS